MSLLAGPKLPHGARCSISLSEVPPRFMGDLVIGDVGGAVGFRSQPCQGRSPSVAVWWWCHL